VNPFCDCNLELDPATATGFKAITTGDDFHIISTTTGTDLTPTGVTSGISEMTNCNIVTGTGTAGQAGVAALKFSEGCLCVDGIDNDCNGLVDGDDDSCPDLSNDWIIDGVIFNLAQNKTVPGGLWVLNGGKLRIKSGKYLSICKTIGIKVVNKPSDPSYIAIAAQPSQIKFHASPCSVNPICTPGATQACSPPAGGLQTCNVDGMVWGPCTGCTPEAGYDTLDQCLGTTGRAVYTCTGTCATPTSCCGSDTADTINGVCTRDTSPAAECTCYQCADQGGGVCGGTVGADSPNPKTCPPGSFPDPLPSCQTCWTVTKKGVLAADLWDDQDRCGSDPCDPWNHCAPPPYSMTSTQGKVFSRWCGPYSASDWNQVTASTNASAAVWANCSAPLCGNYVTHGPCTCCPTGIGEKGENLYLCPEGIWSVGTPTYTCKTDDACP